MYSSKLCFRQDDDKKIILTTVYIIILHLLPFTIIKNNQYYFDNIVPHSQLSTASDIVCSPHSVLNYTMSLVH